MSAQASVKWSEGASIPQLCRAHRENSVPTLKRRTNMPRYRLRIQGLSHDEAQPVSNFKIKRISVKKTVMLRKIKIALASYKLIVFSLLRLFHWMTSQLWAWVRLVTWTRRWKSTTKEPSQGPLQAQSLSNSAELDIKIQKINCPVSLAFRGQKW